MTRPQAPCPPDSLLMRAWEAYQKTEEFENTLYWLIYAKRQAFEQASEGKRQTTLGSLWAAFCAGYTAAGGQP